MVFIKMMLFDLEEGPSITGAECGRKAGRGKRD
jgi:hypothetical protein